MSPSGKESGRAPDQVNLSSLFTRRYKHAGRDILRPMWFYISLNKNGYAATKRLIINHGGKVSTELGDQKTSKEICLIDPHAKASRYGRPAYSVDYIQSCITAQRLLNIEDFRIAPVGRARKTPSKQHRSSSDPNPPIEDGRRKPEHQSAPQLTQNGDSEVTDDLPLIAQPGNDEENYKLTRANGQKKTGISPERTPLNSMEGITDKTVNNKEQDEGQAVQTRQESRQPNLIAPKKRRLPDWMEGTVEGNRGNDASKAPCQAAVKIKDSMDWSKEEDDIITELCVEAKKMYHDTNRDPNKVFSLNCWSRLEGVKFLPDGRSAGECLARAKELWKNGDTETPEIAEENETHDGTEKRALFSPPHTGDPGGEDEIRENQVQPESDLGPQSVPERREAERPEEREALKNASRLETREYIFELVSRIAKRGKVTKRSAFRALREERGHWKRALRLITHRKGRSSV